MVQSHGHRRDGLHPLDPQPLVARLVQRDRVPHLERDLESNVALRQGLREVVDRAQLEAPLDVVLGRRGARHEERDPCQGLVLPHAQDHVEPVLVRHHEVQQKEIDLLTLHDPERLLAAFRLEEDVVPLTEHHAQELSAMGLVVNDQQVERHGSSWRSGTRSVEAARPR